MRTYDKHTIDSTGAFLIGELERLDQTMHEPLVDYTWARDIDLREDVSIADELSSFTNATFAAAGGINPTGKSWIGKDSNAITGIQLDLSKTANPLYLWAMELGYTIPELMSAQAIGRPIDAMKLQGIQIKHQMDIDEQVYIGDTSLGKKGLINNDTVVTNGFVAASGTASSTLWSAKTPALILADVNAILTAAWAASGYKICPNRLLLPPTQFGYIYSQNLPNGSMSIGQFIEQNAICLRVNGTPLQIVHCKWLVGRGTAVSSPLTVTDRMVAYTKEQRLVRFPMVPLQRTPLEYRSLFQLTTYYGRLGVVEMVYPETLYYKDGI